MEKDDFLKDDFLHDLMQHVPEESPSDDFVSHVMASVKPLTDSGKQTFVYYFRSFLPYAAITLALILFIVTSDLPSFDFIPGKEFFINTFRPYITSMTNGFHSLFGNMKNLSIPLMVVAAAGIFFFIDKLFAGRKMAHQTSL